MKECTERKAKEPGKKIPGSFYHINVPKILVISAIYGYEQVSAYSTALFFKDLAESWQDKEQLEFLRWNVDFVIIPVANPYGYDSN